MSTRSRRRWTSAIDRVTARLHRRGDAARPSRAAQHGAGALSELFDDAPFGFAYLDELGRYRLVNQRLATLDGIPVADHVGWRPSELDPAGPLDEASIDRVLRTGVAVRSASTAVLDPRSGSERYLVTSCFPARAESGRVTAVGVMTLDVTDQELSARRAEQLLHFAGLAGAATSIDTLARAVVQFVSATFRARCAVGEVGGERLRIVAVQGFTAEVCERWLRDGFALSDPRPMTAAVRERIPVEVRSLLGLPARYAALAAEQHETGDAAVIAIPLQDPVADTDPGAIAVIRLSWPHAVDLGREGWTTLRTVVSMAELALSRIVLNDRQQAAIIRARVAEETDALSERRRIAIELLQRAALPEQLPSIEGVALEAVYRPAMTGNGVGGDWYDAFVLGPDRIGLVIADVAGHGEEAASFMVQVRNALRAMALEHEQPHVVLERINAVALSLRDDDAPFITCCYSILDARNRTLVWSTAGHFDPLVVGAERVRYPSAPHRPPLTVSQHPKYVSSAVELCAGDRVVMFTDGLIERRGEPIDEGLARLARRAADLRGEKIGDCLESLLQLERERFDDVALICAELVDPSQ